jgi:zinc protease
MLKEIEGMRSQEISAEELTLARESIGRSLPALFQTAGSTVETVSWLYLFDQAPNYYESLPERLATMTAAEVFDVTKRHLRPEDMRIIAVGDRKKIEPQLRALGLGSIGIRDADGKIVAH